MATRDDLVEWVVEALQAHGGSASPLEVSKAVWDRHRLDLERSGDLFFTWQYDLRWAATRLRGEGRMVSNRRGEPWALA